MAAGAAMMNTPIENSPQVYARIAGALYLVVIVLGAFAEGYVSNVLIVPGDPAASAHHILNAPGLWQFGIACNLIVALCAVPQTWIEYLLLRPAGKNLILLGVFFNLLSIAIESIAKLFLLLVLPTLVNAGYRQAFDAAQLEAIASLAIRSHGIAFHISLIFFGFTCLVNGYLVCRSGYFPKTLGVLMQLAGVSYLIACFSALFAPALADKITPAILLPALIGEASFCLWLLIKGVNVARWRERLGAAERTTIFSHRAQ